MTEFQKLKQALISCGEKTTHFTKAFVESYKNARAKSKFCIENEIDDSYYSGIVRLYHSWDDVYDSRFYQKNSTAYCKFLEIANEMNIGD